MFLQRIVSTGLLATLVLVLAACSGGDNTNISNGTTGTLHMALTDTPACGYDAVNVTIQKIRVNKSASASDSDSGWSEIMLNPAKRIDLLSLQNGVLADLGQTPLPAGKYTQLRLVLAGNDSSLPLANSVIPTGGTETPLKTPSGLQTGLKMNVDFDVLANQMIDLVLDFNACKSVVKAGNSGKYLLKPVISVTPKLISGVAGYVGAGLANGTTNISLQQGGVVVKATTPDNTGNFLLQPVSPGTYDLVVTAPSDAALVITDVVVASGTVTPVNTSTTPFTLTGSDTGTASGTITAASSPIDATVDALQTLSGSGHTIDVESVVADADTGIYALLLPVEAPIVASYVMVPGTLSFAADTAVAGNYGLQATSSGVTKSVVPIMLTSGQTVTTDFAFP